MYNNQYVKAIVPNTPMSTNQQTVQLLQSQSSTYQFPSKQNSSKKGEEQWMQSQKNVATPIQYSPLSVSSRFKIGQEQNNSALDSNKQGSMGIGYHQVEESADKYIKNNLSSQTTFNPLGTGFNYSQFSNYSVPNNVLGYNGVGNNPFCIKGAMDSTNYEQQTANATGSINSSYSGGISSGITSNTLLNFQIHQASSSDFPGVLDSTLQVNYSHLNDFSGAGQKAIRTSNNASSISSSTACSQQPKADQNGNQFYPMPQILAQKQIENNYMVKTPKTTSYKSTTLQSSSNQFGQLTIQEQPKATQHVKASTSHLLSPSIDQSHLLVQSTILQRNRSLSPTNPKSSQNFGQASSTPFGSKQGYRLPSSIVTINQSSSKNSANQISIPSENGIQMNQPVLASGPTSQQNFYKVASQIRRNQIKERRPSLVNTINTGGIPVKGGNQMNGILGQELQVKGNENNFIKAFANENELCKTELISKEGNKEFDNDNQKGGNNFHGQSLTLSLNNGRVDRNQQAIGRQSGTKRQNSRGSQSDNLIAPESKDSRKRFTVVEKFNEKYTKKLIIDLCGYLNTSQEQKAQLEGFDNSKQIQSEFDVQQKQRNLSNSKRGAISSININANSAFKKQPCNEISLNGIHTPLTEASKNNSNGTKRLSFKFNEKPWENSSFQNNAKYISKGGSFTAMKSMNSSQSDWNLNGTNNLNSSLSSINKQSSKKPSNILGALASQGALTTEEQKDKNNKNESKHTNNFILADFNDSQEVHSSRALTSKHNDKPKQKREDYSSRSHLTKNVTADLTVSPQNQNGKYKFSQNHLSKPSSSNAYTKSLQTPVVKSKQKDFKQSCSQNNKISPRASSVISQIPVTAGDKFPSTQNSKNGGIQKQSLGTVGISQREKSINMSRSSNQDSFEEDEENDLQAHEDVEDQEIDDDDNDGDLEFEQQSDQNDNGNIQLPPNLNQQSQIFSLLDAQINLNSLMNNKINADGGIQFQTYNFESQLELPKDVKINIEELKRERLKLIRKITQTFKIKNKALSTSQEYYKLLHVIGKGAFAKVCLAIQLLTGKLVAIKLIDKSILRSDSAKKRVLQEVSILKKLNGHKHVLKLLEVFENRKLIFIVTEYFKGQDLMKVMKERNGEPFTENQVRFLLQQILSGLKYIHGNMVLHRDIKLDNLLVDSQLNLKVIDFGISRVIQRDQHMTEQCGTPAFLAPEIIANKGYEGFGSDMWSLGVLIYILLFGKVPFKGNNLCELHKSILSGIIPVEEMKDTSVSKEAQDLILRILKVKVRERINLEGVISSPWMKGFPVPDGLEKKEDTYFKGFDPSQQGIANVYQDLSLNGSVAAQNETFDERIIGQIESFGYSREYILRCLNKGSLSHVNAVYKMIKGSNNTIEEKSY